ncbi:unnamed protein product [Brassicogethes aeneus]|uniref:PCNA-associated factor histone-like domain-containing protein n=1 Tax=Brassicogethes aeneus TaxID=1431903 RepID=A0A9P0FMJ0_BRAAE|nr:unnamed protein product [Brassicogethes aeneus]
MEVLELAVEKVPKKAAVEVAQGQGRLANVQEEVGYKIIYRDNRLGVAAQRETPTWQKPITNFFNMPPKIKLEGETSENQEVLGENMEVVNEVTIKTEVDEENKENCEN